MSHSLSGKFKRIVAKVEDSLPGALIKRFIEIDLLTHAASLAFFALISLAPLLVLLLWLTASLYPEAQDALIEQIGELAGENAGAVASTVIANAREQPDVGSLAGLWSTLLLFIGATAVFAQLQATLNRIFRTDDSALGGVLIWLRKRAFSFGVVFALGFLVVVSTVLTTIVELLLTNLPLLLPVVSNVMMLLLYTLSFAMLYHYLPDRRVPWRRAFLGGLITSLLFLLGRWGIGLYLGQAAPGSAYGSMGTLVVLIMWMYYAAMIFFVGALITAVIDERSRERIFRLPRPTDTFASPPAPRTETAPPAPRA